METACLELFLTNDGVPRLRIRSLLLKIIEMIFVLSFLLTFFIRKKAKSEMGNFT